MNHEAVCRTAPATPGLLIIRNRPKIFLFLLFTLFNLIKVDKGKRGGGLPKVDEQILIDINIIFCHSGYGSGRVRT